MFTSSLNCKNPANAKRNAAVNQTFDNVSWLFVSVTIALRMSIVMGSFLLVGLAKAFLKPLKMVVTREFSLWGRDTW